MTSLTNTDLAAVTVRNALYLFYQKETQLFEASSENAGASWKLNSSPIADKCNPNGSALTAYYLEHDGYFNDKAAIHVIYIDDAGTLNERVKLVESGQWETIPFPDDIKHQPTLTSKLHSGVCHDSSPGGHHWVFFEAEDPNTSDLEINELRRGPGSQEAWSLNKVLPEKHGVALDGAYLASNITGPYNYLIFQNHDGQIAQYRGSLEKWDDMELLNAIQAERTTPLSACSSTEEGKPHIFFVNAGSPPKIMHYLNQTVDSLTSFYPGSALGSTKLDSKIFLFYRKLVSPYQIVTFVYDGSQWKEGSAVV